MSALTVADVVDVLESALLGEGEPSPVAEGAPPTRAVAASGILVLAPESTPLTGVEWTRKRRSTVTELVTAIEVHWTVPVVLDNHRVSRREALGLETVLVERLLEVTGPLQVSISRCRRRLLEDGAQGQGFGQHYAGVISAEVRHNIELGG